MIAACNAGEIEQQVAAATKPQPRLISVAAKHPKAGLERKRPGACARPVNPKLVAGVGLNQRPSGYELEGHTLSPDDSIALRILIPLKPAQIDRVLEPSWTLVAK